MRRGPALPCVLLSALLLLAAFTAPAGAGGWGTATLDHLPGEVHAGQTYRLGYTLLQHGITPVTGAATSIRAWSSDGHALTFSGRPEGAPGHYVADIMFPSAGAWTWEIDPGSFAPQKLAPLSVLAADAPRTRIDPAAPAPALAVAPPAETTPASLRPLRPLLPLATVLAGAALIAVAVAGRRRPVAPAP